MKTIQVKLIEGYFRNPNDEASFIYPSVRARPKAWKGRRAFLVALEQVEASDAVTKKKYKGASECRCCGEANGNAEFNLRLADNVLWVWPEGLIHYVREHNVRPSLAFQLLIEHVVDSLI